VIVTSVLEVFADVACPFTHVGLRRIVDRRRAFGADVVLQVRAWPLELVNGQPLGVALVAEEVRELREQVAPDLFAGFDAAQFPPSSLPAMTLAAAAYRQDLTRGEHVSLALRDALFEQGRDIAAPDVLADIAAAHGLDAPDVVDRDAIVADWEDGRRRGVQGSPYFFTGDGGYFCPSLDIERVEERLKITADPAGLEQFLERALPAS
jgi:predicted DsbA family dithiol-disulfide isomerase